MTSAVGGTLVIFVQHAAAIKTSLRSLKSLRLSAQFQLGSQTLSTVISTPETRGELASDAPVEFNETLRLEVEDLAQHNLRVQLFDAHRLRHEDATGTEASLPLTHLTDGSPHPTEVDLDVAVLTLTLTFVAIEPWRRHPKQPELSAVAPPVGGTAVFDVVSNLVAHKQTATTMAIQQSSRNTLREACARLTAFNSVSEAAYNGLATDFTGHTKMLIDMKKTLQHIQDRILFVQEQLDSLPPE
eukprot:NODE_788_length_1342_cov_265.808971_g596_i0.p1 GENE.NODE_788_length_1342_cov_265.808971_g596_i0~~NODE_788_length_1342_cov_265.808971_g596_i0.p1  ORF type:complete len:243 (+),score=60.02 NODE_788_length_1342_cov_265.808971_g596_i0:477-1205(+)